MEEEGFFFIQAEQQEQQLNNIFLNTYIFFYSTHFHSPRFVCVRRA